MNIFEKLYAAEINIEISSFWDAGFAVRIGDHMNGYKAVTDGLSWREVEPWLESQARALYPEIM